jgi:ABC-2 type transport system permease protein
VLLILALAVIVTGHTIPHGVVPMLLILATLPLIGFCIISSTTMAGESEGWMMAANLVCNSSYWFLWYLLTRIPSLTGNWTGPVVIWNQAARIVIASEFAVIAVILALTLFFQSRKSDFV